MPANYNLNTQPLARGSSDNTNTDLRSFIPARVKKVILDNTDPEYVKYGSSEAVGVIKYSKLSDNTDDSDKGIEALKEAYPLTSTFRTLPLVNEIVLLLKAPAPSIRSSANNSRTYYTTIVSMWNHPNHNGYPVGDTLELGEDIEEGVDINPLQPFPGDIILDGRQGQSIRMGGYKAQSNTFTDDSNQGKPLTLISNGQKLIDNSFTPIVEDINEDASSIYLLSDHSSKLVQANFKRVTYDKKPATAQDYKGSQVIINGGRLFFNAKNESALISAAESVGLNANTLNFDAHKYICLDGEAIFLGVGARVAGPKVKQPIVLGHRMETYLSDVLDVLIEITTGMSKAKTIKGDPLPGLIDVGSSALKQIKDNLKSQLNPGGISNLKSKKVFTE